MIQYEFQILSITPLKGKKIEGTRDYQVQATVKKDGKVIFDGPVNVRRNTAGIFPEEVQLKTIKSASVRKELIQELKAFVKKLKK